MDEKLTNDQLFRFHWLDGKVEELRGNSASDAMNRAGYGNGALGALDYWERVAEPPSDDMELIGQMLASANAHHLLTEVVWSFGNDRAGGSSVREAVEFALSEWDL